MKNPLRLILALAGAALLAAPVLRADDPPAPPAANPAPPAAGPEHRREHGGPGAMMEKMAKELGLTADQEAKWKEIGQQEKTALEAIRADTSLSKEDKWAKRVETNKTFVAQRRALLNPDQQKKFDDLLAKMREKRGARGDHPPGDMPPPPPPGN